MTRRLDIVTRTRDRTPYLSRAMAMLAAQDVSAFVWRIVNDGGDVAAVDAVAAAARGRGIDVRVTHMPQSVGRGAAANAGVRAGAAPYVLLHDDDDTLEPDFVTLCCAALDARPGAAGVVGAIVEIGERGPDDALEEAWRREMEIPAELVGLGDLAQRNRFAPIGFVFRRAAYEAAGGYPEDMPVLEDWELHLKAAAWGDILRLPQAQANLHRRIDGRAPVDPAANTIDALHDEYARCEARLRQRLLRQDLAAGRFGLGALLEMTRQNAPQRRLNRWMDIGRARVMRSGLLRRLFGR